MRKDRRILVCMLATTALALAPSIAAGADESSVALSATDRQFAQTATDRGAKEVALSELAQRKAANGEVRAFAKRMVSDHARSNAELGKFVERVLATGAPPSKRVEPELEYTIEDLQNLSGAAFDRRYMGVMVEDHQDAVARYERQAAEGDDPELKAFARGSLPTLRAHLESARKLARQVGAPAAEAGPSAAR